MEAKRELVRSVALPALRNDVWRPAGKSQRLIPATLTCNTFPIPTCLLSLLVAKHGSHPIFPYDALMGAWDNYATGLRT